MKSKKIILGICLIFICNFALLCACQKKQPVSMTETESQQAEVSQLTQLTDSEKENRMQTILVSVNGHVLKAKQEDNSSAEAFVELLANGSLTISMKDYANMEKVGGIGTTLPRNDEPITTEPGDLILYLGNQLTIYYAPNTWNFTRLGKIQNVSADELKEILGDGDVTVTLSLEK